MQWVFVRPELPVRTRVQMAMHGRSTSSMGISGKAVAYSWLLAIAVAVIAALLNA